jgi:hypothetical protein
MVPKREIPKELLPKAMEQILKRSTERTSAKEETPWEVRQHLDHLSLVCI